MAESSFDRTFHITDPSAIKQFEHDLENSKVVEYSKRDMEQENRKGVELVQRKLQTESACTSAM